MKKTYCLLNHTLSEKQIAELKEKFDSESIIYPTEELSKKWSQIPTTQKIDRSIIESVIEWLSTSQKDDCLIVQGEMGSVFMLVDYALKNGLIPLHAVSERKTIEKKNEDGTSVKTAIFEHVCFRKYERW